MSENESVISGFCEVTGVSEEEATFYLESSGWVLQDALTTFFASERENAREESVSPTMADSENEAEIPVPAPKPTSIPKSKPRIATLSSLKKESSSEDEEGQHFYAGGSVHSGQEVVGPNKPRDMISDMFRSVRDLGATEASTSQSKPKTFKGTGYRLGQTSDDTEVFPGQTETRRREVVLRLWVNGFSVDDGPLRLYTNPENRKFLDKIKFGQVPEELIQDGNETVDLSMEDHRHEEFKAPKSVARVFSGTGNILGSLAPKVTASEPQPVPTAEPGPPVEVDRTQPITAIQIRLDDGSRVRAELNHTHTIADLRNFLTNARPDYRGIPFSLLSTYPSKELDDDTVTIAQAGILNASILLRKK